jgi:hypothetical protein
VQTLQAEEWARFIYYQSVIFLFFASARAGSGSAERENKQKGSRTLFTVPFSKMLKTLILLLTEKQLISLLIKIVLKIKNKVEKMKTRLRINITTHFRCKRVRCYRSGVFKLQQRYTNKFLSFQ